MSVNELPVYPTPQQASYVIGSNAPPRAQPTPSSNAGSTVYRPPQTKKYSHLQPNMNYNTTGQPQYPSNSRPQQQQPPGQYQQPQSRPSQQFHHQPEQQSQHHYSQQQYHQQYQQHQPPPPQHQQSSQQFVPQQYHQQSSQYQPAPPPPPPPSQQYQGHQLPPQQVSYQSPPQSEYVRHTDEQSLASTFNQMRISSQQSYQQPQPQPQMSPQPTYQQPSGPSNQQQTYNSSKVRPTQSGNSTSTTLHKKPPPESREKQKVKLDQELRQVFDKVDKNKSGKISARELSQALSNFDHTRFQDSAIILMIKLFSTGQNSNATPSKHLNFEQFVSLWKHLSAYKKLFIQADTDQSGDISFGEFQKILSQMGYKLNIDLVLHLFQRFSYKNLDEFDAGTTVGKLKFDSFVELLVYLKKLTDVFKKYDKDLKGIATIGFSDFLFEVSNLT